MSGSASRERLRDPLRDVVVVTLDELVNTVLVQLTDLVKQRHCTARHTSSQHTHHRAELRSTWTPIIQSSPDLDHVISLKPRVNYTSQTRCACVPAGPTSEP